MDSEAKATEQLEPLKIRCTSADCDNDLHCFLATKKMRIANEAGRCRYCGADLIEWSRVQRRDIADVDNTFRAIQQEYIRHHFWHVAIDEKAILHAQRKGRAGLKEAADKRIRKSVGTATPPYDGRQTKWSGNILYYAQHATASCCRRCIEEWHGIPKGAPLTEDEVRYLVQLINRYVESRLPELAEKPQVVRRNRPARDSAPSGTAR